MYRKVQIKNLKLFTEIEIENLGQVNLIVGKNNCGKTTLLEALFFLIGATNPSLPVNTNVFRGLPFLSNTLWPTYFYNLNWNFPIEIIGQLRNVNEEEYLLISPKFKEVVSNERPIAVASAGDSSPEVELDGLELEYRASKQPNSIIKTKVFLRGKELISEGAKQRSVRGIFVSPLTEFDWKKRFDALQLRKRVPEVVSTLKSIEPRLSDLRLNSIGLLVGDIDLPNLMPISLFGGGTARFLSIAMAMLDSPNGIVLIDEIDSGLHYSAQKTIWEAVISWAFEYNVQVFATTHSYECIEAFTKCSKSRLFSKECRLFRIDRKDSKFKTVIFETENLERFLDKKWEIR